MTVDAGLPNFVKALPAHLTAEDAEYLRHKGIFHIPGTGCRNEILRAHFQFVHPLMPLLDVESFVGPMLQSSPSEKISLLLLYAVLCSGAAHVEIGVLHAMGYQSRKAARKAFFDRARLLYDFDCEPERLSLVQAFLLMTYWWHTGTQHKDRRFWIREGVSLALDLGLGMDLDDCGSKPRRLIKRIWWCCFMRDQFVALMTWTPAHLGARHRNLPMLTLEDFEVEAFSELITDNFGQWPLVNSRETRVQLATLCIEKAKLCVCISRILEARYSSRRLEAATQMVTILVPKRAAVDQYEVIEHDHELQAWYHNLVDASTLDLRDAATAGPDVVSIQKGHLKLLFLTALLALHRPQAVDTLDVRLSASQELSNRKLRETAEEVAHVAKRIQDLEMGTHMNPNGISLFLPVLLVHLQDIRPETRTLKKSRLEKYHDCMRILDSIGGDVVPENLLPMKLESAFRRLNVLPSTEYTIPRLLRMSGEQFPASGNDPISLLSNLGVVTQFEMDFLQDLNACAVNAGFGSIQQGSRVEESLDGKKREATGRRVDDNAV
ncbi:hypothetical protein LTR67_009694 [Exophiala xenobiotica]